MLRVGDRVRHQEHAWRVAAVDGLQVQLTRAAQDDVTVAVIDLVTAQGYALQKLRTLYPPSQD